MEWDPYTREQTLRQRALRALILSLPFTGLGHAYLGQVARGLTWIGALAAALAITFAVADTAPAWMALGSGAGVGAIVLAAALDALRLARLADAPPHNRVGCVAAVIALGASYLFAVWIAEPAMFHAAFKARPSPTRILIAQPA